MRQVNERTQWASDAAGRDGNAGGGPAERIAEALKRLADLLFPAPEGTPQPVPVRIRTRR